MKKTILEQILPIPTGYKLLKVVNNTMFLINDKGGKKWKK